MKTNPSAIAVICATPAHVYFDAPMHTRRYYHRSSAPTATPSASPITSVPTNPGDTYGPSHAPTAAPSSAPSAASSASPSSVPSAAPSAAPSSAPSATPTAAPTLYPTTAAPSAPTTFSPVLGGTEVTTHTVALARSLLNNSAASVVLGVLKRAPCHTLRHHITFPTALEPSRAHRPSRAPRRSCRNKPNSSGPTKPSPP